MTFVFIGSPKSLDPKGTYEFTLVRLSVRAFLFHSLNGSIYFLVGHPYDLDHHQFRFWPWVTKNTQIFIVFFLLKSYLRKTIAIGDFEKFRGRRFWEILWIVQNQCARKLMFLVFFIIRQYRRGTNRGGGVFLGSCVFWFSF